MRSRGFTLIEVLITVAIIGVLAALAIPHFQFYRSKSKTAEVNSTMGAIRMSQQSVFAEYDNYANIAVPNPASTPGPHKRAWEFRVCPAACSRLNPAPCTEFSCIGFEPSGNVLYSYVARGFGVPARTEFAIGAAGDTDADLQRGSFTIQSANAGGGLGLFADGFSTCPVGVPADHIVECRPGVF